MTAYAVHYSYNHWDPSITQRCHGRRTYDVADRYAAIREFWAEGFSPMIVTIDDVTPA